MLLQLPPPREEEQTNSLARTSVTADLLVGAQGCSGCVSNGDLRKSVANGKVFPFAAIGEQMISTPDVCILHK